MANEEQLAILKHYDVEEWNDWRWHNSDEQIDLENAELDGINLRDADLHNANLRNIKLRDSYLRHTNFSLSDLRGANLSDSYLDGANFSNANLGNANLSSAELIGAFLMNADLSGANLRYADFSHSILHSANLTGVDLRNADLTAASLIEARFEKANLTGCRIYGVSAWNVNMENAIQANLIITPESESVITVDNVEVAQFIYLLLHNEKLRGLIDTVGKKAVLILGRFTKERKAVLDAIRDELRKRDYIPILFDFEKPSSRDVTETVSTLAHMARFVIADLTDAKSIPQELAQIVPHLPSVAVQPLILQGQREYGMFEHWQRYGWVLPIHEYATQAGLIAELGEKVIAPAEAKVNELRQK
jgi:uncharacterized protein YjbI with pentapeptide repeats